MIIALLLQAAVAASGQSSDVVVTGERLDATEKALRACVARDGRGPNPSRRPQPSMRARVFLTRSSMAKGLVSTAMPASRSPPPTAALSA